MEGQRRIGLLGAVEVTGADGSTAVTGDKRQALLALLALAVPQPVSADRLIDELWGDDPPGNPANALQAQVTQLRSILGREVVARRGGGYALALDPSAVDALELERLVAAGRDAVARGEPRRSADAFREAVALLRGPPLAGLVDHPFAREAAARLETAGLDAHEGLAEAELASGRHAEVVPVLTDLVWSHPLRERLHSLLILALYRCGRQADALRAYQAARQVLLDELGVEPGPELKALERAVLSHDPALASPVALPVEPHAASLPTMLSSFVGRDEELRRLLELIDEARLVGVIGVGGMGKTRLALAAVERLAVGGEVWFVELAPVTDPVAVPEAIAAAVGAHDLTSADGAEATRPPDERTVERLGSRQAVVVLDNCEHVVGAVAATVQVLLRGCPGVTVVVTSREPLGLAGEQQLALGPMTGTDATQLFTDRARSAQPRFAEAEVAIEELCRRLDRLPLAIELAAARTRTLPVAEITERLDDRFALLPPGGRIGDGGHDGLAAAIDGSYESLFDDERRVFCGLAVFAGGATIEAVQELCGADALDLVERLVDKSLVVPDTGGPRARFRMLESLRAYGLERLAEEGRLDGVLRAHLGWCVALAETAEPHVAAAEQLDWLDRLDAEHDNLRAALAHAVEADPESGLRLIGALIQAWWFRGRHQEARHWVESCLTAATEATPAIRAKALAWSALLSDTGTWTERPGAIEDELIAAEARTREAVALLADHDDAHAVAETHMLLLMVVARRAVTGGSVDHQELDRLIPAVIEDYEALDDSYGLALLSAIWAIVALVAGDLERAASSCEWTRFHADRTGERFTGSRAAWLAGILAEVRADPVSAYPHIERALRLVAELGLERQVTAQAGLLARLADLNDAPELAAQWRAFVAERGDSGLAVDDLNTAASARNAEGVAARAEGRLERARSCHLEARDIYRETGTSGGVAFSESCLGFLATEAGDDGLAAGHHRAALDAAVDSREPRAIALALEGLASISAGSPTAAECGAALLGGAEQMWATVGQVDPTHRVDVAAVRQDLEALLDTDAFASAFQRGASLEGTDLVAIARSAAGPG